MINWSEVRSVFLDLDGTLLDLRYDNHFWRHYLPVQYADRHGLTVDAARATLFPKMKQLEGTIHWYCVDFWSSELDLDIAGLKREISHLIAIRPGVEDFLKALHRDARRVVLVTNAHHKSLDLKMEITGLDLFFDAVVSSHRFGLPKEHPGFWPALQQTEPFDPERTLFIDDSLPVLESARTYGIRHLLSIRQPDSGQPVRTTDPFDAIDSFAKIIPPLAALSGTEGSTSNPPPGDFNAQDR